MRTDQTYSRFSENDTRTIRERLNELPSQKKEISRRPEKVTLLKLVGVPALACATALGAIAYINGMNYFKENPPISKFSLTVKRLKTRLPWGTKAIPLCTT